jgi:hypothetical protein
LITDLSGLRAAGSHSETPAASEWPTARPAFLSQRNDGAVAKLCHVKILLPDGKPDDDFGGALLVGVGPQIKLANDSVQGFYNYRSGFRTEGSTFV